MPNEACGCPGARIARAEPALIATVVCCTRLGQKTLGTPRCLKDLIEEEVFERRRDLFSEVERGIALGTHLSASTPRR